MVVIGELHSPETGRGPGKVSKFPNGNRGCGYCKGCSLQVLALQEKQTRDKREEALIPAIALSTSHPLSPSLHPPPPHASLRAPEEGARVFSDSPSLDLPPPPGGGGALVCGGKGSQVLGILGGVWQRAVAVPREPVLKDTEGNHGNGGWEGAQGVWEGRLALRNGGASATHPGALAVWSEARAPVPSKPEHQARDEHTSLFSKESSISLKPDSGREEPVSLCAPAALAGERRDVSVISSQDWLPPTSFLF